MDFTQGLDKNLDEIEKPPLVPRGTYIGAVSKHPTLAEVGGGNWDKVAVPVKLIAPTEDVDPDELQAFGDIKAAFVENVFMFDKSTDGEAAFKRTEYNLKMFLQKTLLLPEGISFKEAFAASVGVQFLVTIDWYPEKDNPENIWPRIKSTAPIE